jgi:hypothetical protein
MEIDGFGSIDEEVEEEERGENKETRTVWSLRED